jgi:hypothetical protein
VYWYLIPAVPITHVALGQAAPQVQSTAGWAGTCSSQAAHLRHAGREEHHGPHHAHAGHPGGQRRADSGRAEHHPRDLRQRHLRADVREVTEAIREGETIAKPMREHSKPKPTSGKPREIQFPRFPYLLGLPLSAFRFRKILSCLPSAPFIAVALSPSSKCWW